mgnify:CR=1 FL=1
MHNLQIAQKFVNTMTSIIILIERDDGKKKQTLENFTAEQILFR